MRCGRTGGGMRLMVRDRGFGSGGWHLTLVPGLTNTPFHTSILEHYLLPCYPCCVTSYLASVTMRLMHQLTILALSLISTSVPSVNCHLSCGPRVSPRMLLDIPCDLESSNYCNTPGSSYPWSAVRRYIYDNQAIMRQMYGDQRQSYIVQNEIEELREKYDNLADLASLLKRGRSLVSSQVDSSGVTSKNVSIAPSLEISTNGSLVEEENVTTGSPDADPTESTSEATSKVTPILEAKKGFQACQVKEEIISPYWAKNVHGEPYPIVNVFPFDQYVHAEKCVEEFTQGFCHKGCRCEQRYRLHRLLAYDVKNQCRGIFSDWFRFPSSCICICYDANQSPSQSRVSRRKARV